MQGTRTLRRSLSMRDLIVYGLLFIGPLAPVGVFGVLDARTHGAVALVYLLATVAMAFTAWSYAEMSQVVPHAGSVFAYAREGIGPRAGFLAGWLAMLDYLLIPSVAYLFCGIALHALVPSVPAWIFTVIAFVITTSFNLAGVSLAARVGTLVLAIEVAILLLFIVVAVLVIVRGGGAREWLSPFLGLPATGGASLMTGGAVTAGAGAGDVSGSTGAATLPAIVGAISVAVLSYLGFDAIAAFAEESTGGPRTIGRGIFWCLLGSGLLFIVQTWLAAVLSPITPATLAAHPEQQGTAFYDITRLAIGGWLATTLASIKAVGPAFAAMTAQAAAARLLFGMARDGRLPRALASVDDRYGVPRAALVTAAALTLVVSVWAARRPDGLDILVSIVDIGALAAFTLLHVSVVGYFVVAKRAPARLAHRLVPVVGALITIWVIVEASLLAKLVAGTWLAAGLIAVGLGRSGGPAATSTSDEAGAPGSA